MSTISSPPVVVGALLALFLAGCSSGAGAGKGGPGDAGDDESGGTGGGGGTGGMETRFDAGAGGSGPADSGAATVDTAIPADAPPDAPADGSPSGGPFALTSPAFKAGDIIDPMYWCMNANVSPPLAWTPGPSGTQSYAVTLTLVKGTTVHWVLWDIPPATTSLPPDVAKVAQPPVPAGAKQVTPGYIGPCPTNGVSGYVFSVYALDVATLPGVTLRSTIKEVDLALEGTHKLAKATLMVMAGK
jgi:Raf kinase inhibitor-like YbhB/YbcL family protein